MTDGDSMTINNLRDFAKGTFVTLDDYLTLTFAADQETIETIFRVIVSANELSLFGAVAEMCEKYASLHDRSGRPDIVMGQSVVLGEIKTEVPLDCDDPTNQDLPLQQFEERIEKLSQQDKLSKFCMDAGFLNVVEIGLET